MPKIRGTIIRILDKRTVIINLGKEQGIGKGSEFRILADSEQVVDPSTGNVLGSVVVVKSKVRAIQVFDKFTIAATKWTATQPKFTPSFIDSSTLDAILPYETVTMDEGELNVEEDDIQPWLAESASPVAVGDFVEVLVEAPRIEKREPEDTDEEPPRDAADPEA